VKKRCELGDLTVGSPAYSKHFYKQITTIHSTKPSVMKNLLTLFIIIIFSGSAFAQNTNLVKKNFVTGADMTVSLYDYVADSALAKTSQNRLIFPANWKFKVVGITKDNEIIIKQWASSKGSNNGYTGGRKAKDSLTKLSSQSAYTSDKNDRQYFVVSLADFDSKCEPYFSRGYDFTFGVMTIPIKLRARSQKSGSLFEYDEKFNIGISAGIKKSFNSRKDRSVSLLLNTSISNVKIDSLNTKGFQKEATSTGAFTIATGLVFKQADFNIGFFLGWDKVPGVLGRNWVHYGKPWVGVGIGFSLFSVSITGESTQPKQAGK
jgi:hypothetical protein